MPEAKKQPGRSFGGGANRGGGAGGRGGAGGGAGRGGSRGGRGPRRDEEPKEFDQKTLELARVTRVTKGGKRMRFRALVVVGDRKGRVGFGLAKGADVSISVNKAARKAQKSVIRVPMVNETIPHMAWIKDGAAVLMLKPAPKGTGIRAGGAARVVFELAGIPNIISKTLGSGNKINNVRAAIAALQGLTLTTKEGRTSASGTPAATA